MEQARLPGTDMPVEEFDMNEFTMKLDELRRKAAEGTMTLDEAREATKWLRAGRTHAMQATAAKKARKASTAKKKPDSDALLNDLMSM